MRRNLQVVLLAASVLSTLTLSDANAAKPPLCSTGRFAVAGDPLIGPGGDLIVLENKTITIGTVCAANRAQLKRLKTGTRVKVKFKKNACSGAQKVRLKALITGECKNMAGTLKRKGAAPTNFTATDSVCGDGVIDAGRDETCEQQSDCNAGEVCAACACVAAPVAQRASRSGTIAISDDEALVAMVNPDDDSISIFRTSDDTRLAKVTTGDEPSAIVIAPDSKTAYVANRAAGTVVKVTAIDTATPDVGSPLTVGSEPTGLALSPAGTTLYVAEHAEGRISVVDTAAFTVSDTIDDPANPRALLVTNDGDADEGDELLVVPEFFGEPNDDGEANDIGRTGRVRIYRTSDLAPQTSIVFDPFDSGFGGTFAAPNQLWSVSTRGGRIYVTSVSASPALPLQFDRNVFAIVYVGDLATRTKLDTPDGTTSLTKAIVDQVTTRPRFVMGDLVDMDFIPGSTVSYALSRGADAVQRITWNASGVDLGSAANDQINVLGNATIGLCQAPTGIALKSDATRAYLNCWVTRRLGVIDLTSQTLTKTVEASPAAVGTTEQSVQRGKRFYFTGRGRWSNAGGAGAGGLGAGGNGAAGGEGWSSCGSCHPDGLTDNITWVFGAGPRQTVSQDGSFSHGSGTQQQRIFNYSAIFDEHHDFEANTRGVSGGLGAITDAPTEADCNTLTLETQVALQANLGTPMKEVADASVCKHEDWDDIDAFVKTIRPPRALRGAPADSVTRGRTLFETQGQCIKCHAGAGWTLSRRFFTPSSATNTTLATQAFTEPVAWPVTWAYGPRNQISNQPADIPADATGPAEVASIVPLQVACVVRNIGTFGIAGDDTATNALELKSNNTRAQGRGGYNIPSLYGLALGAPYLHHGQARTLDDLFTQSAYEFHTNAGSANFSVVLGSDAQNLTDLKNFLLSIDEDSEEIDPPAGFDGCPAVFP